jgi:hypothetical protein
MAEAAWFSSPKGSMRTFAISARPMQLTYIYYIYDCLETGAFSESGLQSIHLPGWLEVIYQSCFSFCKSLQFVTFDFLSKLQRIERVVFAWTGLTYLVIPGCVSSFASSALAGLQLRTFSFLGIGVLLSIHQLSD